MGLGQKLNPHANSWKTTCGIHANSWKTKRVAHANNWKTTARQQLENHMRNSR